MLVNFILVLVLLVDLVCIENLVNLFIVLVIVLLLSDLKLVMVFLILVIIVFKLVIEVINWWFFVLVLKLIILGLKWKWLKVLRIVFVDWELYIELLGVIIEKNILFKLILLWWIISLVVLVEIFNLFFVCSWFKKLLLKVLSLLKNVFLLEVELKIVVKVLM